MKKYKIKAGKQRTSPLTVLIVIAIFVVLMVASWFVFGPGAAGA